jgi:phosphoglycerate dehydrogenase-like enzyme
MTEPVPTVCLLSPFHPLLPDWLSTRAAVHHEPAATGIDLAEPAVAGAHVLVLRSNVTLTAEHLAGMPHLRLVLRAGSGTDNLPLDALHRRAVTVVVLGGEPSAPSVAELAMHSTLALLRRIPVATAELAAGRWAKDRCVGEELAGATVGIWGAGPVGRATERLFARFGAQTWFAAHRSVPPGARALPPGELAHARVHVFALPLRPETRGFVDRALLDTFRPARPHLVNVGRWDLFDMTGVLRALGRDELSGVAVDPVDRPHLPLAAGLVARFANPDRPLNLHLTPHLGATTGDAQRRVALAAVDALATRWELLTHQEVP